MALWSDQYGQQKALELSRLFRTITADPALSGFNGAERMPGAQVEDEAAILSDLVKMVEAGRHGTGTSVMGTDPRPSVNYDRTREPGMASLRVIDWSIMPMPVSANANDPAMDVAERASEFILEDSRA